jgi:hypothetical protein
MREEAETGDDGEDGAGRDDEVMTLYSGGVR